MKRTLQHVILTGEGMPLKGTPEYAALYGVAHALCDDDGARDYVDPVSLDPRWLITALEPDGAMSPTLTGNIITAVLTFGSPWSIAKVTKQPVGVVAYQQAVIKEWDDLPEHLTCVHTCACGFDFQTIMQFLFHSQSCPRLNKEGIEMQAAVPTHPSNKTFYEQLLLWGCEPMKERGDHIRLRAPSGVVFSVYKPGIHKGNPSSAFTDAYKAVGVSPQEFWAGPEAPEGDNVRQLALAPQDRPLRQRHKGYVNKVLDVLVEAGCPLSLDRIAKEAQIDKGQASSAASQLVRQGLAERLKSGVYVAKQYAHDHKVGLDINLTTGTPETATEPVPVPDPVPAAPCDKDGHPLYGHDCEEYEIVKALESEEAASGVPAVTNDERHYALDAAIVEPLTEAECKELDASIAIDDAMERFLEEVVPTLKPRHLATINAWRTATLQMIEEVDRR